MEWISYFSHDAIFWQNSNSFMIAASNNWKDSGDLERRGSELSLGFASVNIVAADTHLTEVFGTRQYVLLQNNHVAYRKKIPRTCG